jgi:transposase-like protein
MSKSKRRSASDGARLVAQYKESGLTRAKFAVANNVTVSALQYWIRKMKPGNRLEQTSSARFVEVVRDPVLEESNAAGGGLQMMIGSGVTFRFESLPSPGYVVSLVAAFRQEALC